MMSSTDHQNGAFQQAGNSMGDPGSANPLADAVVNETSSKSENTGQTTTSSSDDHDKKSKKLRGIEVFVGDISFFCKEVDLYKLFSNYGRVMRTRIKRSDKNGRTLMYGFVDMERLEDAKESIKALHQSRFQGRDIRVELSGSRAPTQPARPNHEDYPQIYISFKSEEGNPDGDQLPTESFLREIFEQYSAVKDIAIKEYSYDKTTRAQHGFCFAAFLNLPDAKRVFSTIHGHVHRGFLFSCSVSYHFPLDDDVMTATAAMSLQRERGNTPSSSALNSPRDTNMVHSNHYGRRSFSTSNDNTRKMSGDVPPLMYPQSYVPYGGGPMTTGYSDIVGMTSMYPTMHVMPPIYPMPPQMSSSDGSYMPMQIPIVPPPQSTYPPSGPSPTPHGYMLPSQQTGLYYSPSPTSSLPNTPRDGRTSYYGPPAQQVPTPPAPYHHNNNYTSGATSTTVLSSSQSSSSSVAPLISQQINSFHNVSVGKLEEKPKSVAAMHSHQPQLDYMNNKAHEFQNQHQHQRSTSFNHNNQHHHHSAPNNHNSSHMNMSSPHNHLPANNIYPPLHQHNQPQSQPQAPYYSSMNDQFTRHQNHSNHSHHSHPFHSHISNQSPHHHNVNVDINASNNSHHHQMSSNSTATTATNTASFSAQPHYSSLSTPFFMPDRI